jgi:uncharacterized membrane protein required for colicin V production
MNSGPLNWVDFAVVVTLVVAVFRGRKHGLSEELLPLFRNLGMVAAAGFCYQPVGQFVAESTVFSLLNSYRAAYLALVLAVYVFFKIVKKAVGDKLLTSDLFGGFEYYLGMIAAVLRFATVVLMFFAVLHSRAYSEKELAEFEKQQEFNLGTIRLPSLSSLQHDVFAQSVSGRLVRDNLPFLLIVSTAPEDKSLRDSEVHKRRENDVNNVIEGGAK